VGGDLAIGYGLYHFAGKAKAKVKQQGDAISRIESTLPGGSGDTSTPQPMAQATSNGVPMPANIPWTIPGIIGGGIATDSNGVVTRWSAQYPAVRVEVNRQTGEVTRQVGLPLGNTTIGIEVQNKDPGATQRMNDEIRAVTGAAPTRPTGP
jgi:hypothetical protein